MRKTSVYWILLGVLVLAPTALLAQQTAQPKTKAARGQTAKPLAKTEEAKKEEAKIPTEEAQPKTEEDGKLTSIPGSKALGMSILGNQEAPKALLMVPGRVRNSAVAPASRRCLMTRGDPWTKRCSCECSVTTKFGRKQRGPAVRRRMGARQRPPMWRRGESHEFH